MADSHESAQQIPATDHFMAVVMLYLMTLLAAVIALSLRPGWKGLLHWAGEMLLIIGIGLAARGISDVRREWTRRPGAWGTITQQVHLIRGHSASFLWLMWNRAVEKLPRIAVLLRLRVHQTHKHLGDAGASAEAATVSASAPPGSAEMSGGNVESRVARLEARMAEVSRQFAAIDARFEQEVRHWQDATQEERAARIAEDRRIRERMADLAGGGLKLQAWGVACLLTGTVMTAIW